MLDSEDTHEQNVRERIERDGLGAEIVRQAYVERLQSHMEAFYEHASMADVIILADALERIDRKQYGRHDLHRARLLEQFASLRLEGLVDETCVADETVGAYVPRQ